MMPRAVATAAAVLLLCVAAHAHAVTFTNPLVANESLPDPGALRLADGRIVVATTGGCGKGGALPIHVSSDLVAWHSSGCIFPDVKKHPWGKSDFWAPEVHLIPGTDDGFRAYYTARGADGVLAIGCATATSATGPFHDVGAPLVHNSSMGNIDATFFADTSAADGSVTLYLVWKTDGNAVGKPTPINLARLDATGTVVEGQWVQNLIHNTLPWEGPITEGPWIVRRPGDSYYYLFYSGNIMANYAVGVARALSVAGPYEKLGAPILADTLKDGDAFMGPGHCSVLQTDDGGWAILYHAWRNHGKPVNFGDPRYLMMDAVTWDASSGWPSVHGGSGKPSSSPQPVP